MFNNYIPIIRKIKKELEKIEGDTLKEKARNLKLSEHSLRNALRRKSVLPVTAQQVSKAFGKEVEELFFMW